MIFPCLLRSKSTSFHPQRPLLAAAKSRMRRTLIFNTAETVWELDVHFRYIGKRLSLRQSCFGLHFTSQDHSPQDSSKYSTSLVHED